ncbi:WD-repeat protein, putative [Ricinus communis]|uniref:WD-repeat protein, putative n=1 Tax=Ricinus communis TaxID=3988 RepID=B9RP05_RICCO|nr:WD-repeat protein, putative [Ricinus communis]
MSTLNKELVFLILQFFNEEGFKEAARMLEHDSGFNFNMMFFEEMILNGNWVEAEKYLSGFTKFNDNRYSTKIFFEIRKQKYLEALDKNERAKALDILMNDLKIFAPFNEGVFMEMTQLLTLNDIREHESLSTYGDTEFARKILMLELRKIIEANPLFSNKLKFPSIQSQRLRRLINQGLNWQHINCTHPQPNPSISSLFVDHVCLPPEDHLFSVPTDNKPLPSQNTLMLAAVSSASSKSTASTDSETSSRVLNPGGASDLGIDYQLSQSCKRNFVSTSTSYSLIAITTDCLEDNNFVSEKLPSEASDQETSAVTHLGQHFFSITSHPSRSIFNLPDDLFESPPKQNTSESPGVISNTDLPKTVGRILNEGSAPTSMDFHPVHQTLLLVGTSMGDIGLWEVSSGEKLLSRNFKVWEIGACSTKFKTATLKDPCLSVKRIAWSPEGSLFGAAYSRHIVQIYSYLGADIACQQVEIDAHVGGVNDLAFSIPKDKLLAITCGDDKTIKAWDATTGDGMYIFEGHDAPVYSICPNIQEGVPFIFSTSVHGNIKIWLYDELGARVDYDAPGLGCTSMAYSANNRRLFSCGTSKCGESFLVEWNENEGAIKRTYKGLQKSSLSVVQFDIMKNEYLAAGDEHAIKVWDMNKVELFTIIDADGGLPANPCIRFNKDGSLLAVFADENRIKILATDYALQLFCKSGNCPVEVSRFRSDTFRKNGNSITSEAVKYEFSGRLEQKLFEINKPSQCRTLWLPFRVKANKISSLVYNNAGNSILALASNAIHLVWKWPIDDHNLSGKATTEVSPQFWQPKSCPGPMTNDLTAINHEEALSCFALSNNDSYLISASGGKISLFNMLTFKVIRTLLGHFNRVSSLAFSKALNILVSSGADSQILVWNIQGWEKYTSKFLQIPEKEKPLASLDTHIQFHQDQTQFLAVCETSLSIFEAKTLECSKQWVPGDSTPISHATFSCDSQIVYAGLVDGTVCLFDALHLELQCRIVSSVYRPPCLSFVNGCSFNDYPLVIAAHPQKPSQFAVGMKNGGVALFEPLNRADKWSNLTPEDGPASTMLVESDR